MTTPPRGMLFRPNGDLVVRKTALLETGERRLGRQRGIVVGNTPHRELKPGIVAERVGVRSVFVPARNLIRPLPQKIERRVFLAERLVRTLVVVDVSELVQALLADDPSSARAAAWFQPSEC